MSANAAVNPDFSQVEADVQQLEINTRFALFSPERRPFFQEWADFLTTPTNAVYFREGRLRVAALIRSGFASRSISRSAS